MSIDCVDSLGDAEFFEGWEDYNKTALWNGRELSLSTELPYYPDLASKILPFFIDQDRRLQNNVQQFNLEEALLEQEFEFASNALLTEWMLDNSNEQLSEIVGCKTFLKRMLHEVSKGAKKAAKVFRKAMRAIAHATRKSAKKVEKFVKEYKKEILIAAAVVTALCLIYTATAALAAGAAAVASVPQRKREDGEDEDSPNPDLPPLPDWAKEVLKLNDNDFTSQASLETAKKEAHDAWNLFDHLKTVTEADLAHLRKEDPSFNPSSTAIETILDTVFSNGQRQEFSRNPMLEHNWRSFIDAGHEKIDQAFSLASAHRPATISAPNVVPSILDQAKLGLSIINQSLQNPQLFDPNSRLDLFFKDQNIPIPLENSKQTVSEFLTNIEQTFKADPKSFESKIANIPKVNVPDDFLKIPKSLKVEEIQAATESNRSRYFHTEGESSDSLMVSFTHGINTSLEKATSHANYIRSLLPESHKHLRVDGIYNHSNGPVLDVGEVFLLNYWGCSPITEALQAQKWTEFYEKNKDNPHAKILHICYSQGAIHTRNALMRIPKEIQERIIVVAIAPGAVVLKDFCFKSDNYASKKDFVPMGERFANYVVAAFNDEPERLERLDYLTRIQGKIVWLEPHENAKSFDHDFQSETFRRIIIESLQDYFKNQGLYQ